MNLCLIQFKGIVFYCAVIYSFDTRQYGEFQVTNRIQFSNWNYTFSSFSIQSVKRGAFPEKNNLKVNPNESILNLHYVLDSGSFYLYLHTKGHRRVIHKEQIPEFTFLQKRKFQDKNFDYYYSYCRLFWEGKIVSLSLSF